MDLWDNTLVKPPFAANPPYKINVPAKTYGLVIGILAAIGTLFGLLGLLATFTVNNLCSAFVACESHSALWLASVGALLSLAGAILATVGGFQMYGLQPRGRALIIYGMVLGLAGDILYLIGWGFGFYFGSFIIRVIIYAIVYYFLVISRFPNEAPLVASGAPQGYGQPPYGGPPQQPPPQPPYGPPQQGGPPPQGPPGPPVG
jgi:hypothetical protein